MALIKKQKEPNPPFGGAENKETVPHRTDSLPLNGKVLHPVAPGAKLPVSLLDYFYPDDIDNFILPG